MLRFFINHEGETYTILFSDRHVPQRGDIVWLENQKGMLYFDHEKDRNFDGPFTVQWVRYVFGERGVEMIDVRLKEGANSDA